MIFGAKVWSISSSFNTIMEKEISNVLLRMFDLSDKTKWPPGNQIYESLRYYLVTLTGEGINTHTLCFSM